MVPLVGNARSDMAARLESGVMQANGEIKPEPLMDVEHVAKSIVHIANLPNSVTVDEFRILYVVTKVSAIRVLMRQSFFQSDGNAIRRKRMRVS